MTVRCVACGPFEGKKHDSDCPFQKYETIDLIRGLPDRFDPVEN
jgi:hypothetical protein